MGRAATATTRKSEETQNRILEAALALFRERGFEKTTMRDIAQESRVALGAAYYYFDSKDSLVMEFYRRAQRELDSLLEDALSKTQGLEERLRAAIEVKFRYFAPNRKLLGALSAHIDPQHPLSPFSEETRAIRERDIAFLSTAVDASRVRIPDDLKIHLPRVLWLYQMGLLLFWVYDSSPAQIRTKKLFHKSLSIVVNLIKLSSLPLMRPLRKLATDLFEIVYGEEESTLSVEAP
ncbi:MAG: TetR/AcrR family transcriptional regulator [Candidatus Sulfotelmatobacter sp.]